MTDTPAGRIVLVRHGETEWSRLGRHTGVSDVDLTETGVEQARALRPALHGHPFAAVLCSPRLRARRTAELAELSDVQIEDDLMEWDYGSYEGLTSDQIHEMDPDWLIWTGETPGGETRHHVAERADRVINELARLRTDGDVAVVGHGHFTRALAVRWLGLPVDRGRSLRLGTASLNVLGVDRGVRVIEQWNAPPLPDALA